ncbi:MAG: alpha/beta hydrolase fold domain-containing protein [Dehalococcoidia bacterium]|nr:alpha/beta hydrolase fold domain-containing protein [Dehalococcoidia bacterium]
MPELDLSSVIEARDVVVGKAGDRDLLADVYQPPAGTSKGAALLHLHGGGFRGGAKDGARLAPHMASLGYVSVSSQYRLTAEAKWPAQIEDVKTALRWINAQASDLDIDPAKTVVFGYSAGGQLALIASGTQEDARFNGAGGAVPIAACVALYPPTSMTRPDGGAMPEPMAPDATDGDLIAASPLTYAAPGFPPTILLQGTADTTVPFGSSLAMFEALREAEVPVELHAFPGLVHAFDGYSDLAAVCAPLIDFFLDRYVVNPREYPAMARQAAAR